MTKVVKSRYLVSFVLAAVLAAGLMMLVPPAQAQSEDEEIVGPKTHLNEDLAIAKIAPSRVKERQTITYTIYVAQFCRFCDRAGQNSSDDVTVTDVLPAGVQFLGVATDLDNNSGLSDEFTCTGGSTVTCESDNLYNGDLATITIYAKAKTRGTKVNTASVTLDDPEANDVNPSNNTDSASTRVVRRR